MRAQKIQPTETELALAAVEPFRSTDPARKNLHTPFSIKLWGRDYVAATDGHTAALARCDGAVVTRPADIAPPPPMAAIVPDNAERVGFFRYDDLEALRAFPKAWTAIVSFEPGELPRLNLSRTKGAGRTEKRIEIVKGAALPFANTIEVAAALSVGYLLRAVDFCGAMRVTVWRVRGGKYAELEPVLFTCGSGSYAGEAGRVALVMPCRK